jgi:hypothetical protein
MSGKNSADIRMVVDAMDLCYSKDHIDAFVLVSGDSDFSPLVSKLRENDKSVIGVGLRGSTSQLLVANCDEFIFYEDLVRAPVSVETVNLDQVPSDKKKLFNLLISTIEGLLHEHRGVLHSSLVKDTMKRKKPDFNERTWGYSSFSDLLEEAMSLGLLSIERDERAGGSFVVTKLGSKPGQPASEGRKPARRRRRRSKSDQPVVVTESESGDTAVETSPAAKKDEAAPKAKAPRKTTKKKVTKKTATKKTTTKKTTAKKAPAKKAPAKKTATKKTTIRKKAAKKTAAKKPAAK